MAAAAAALVLLASGTATSVDTAGDLQSWPMFRGATAGSVADNPKLPEIWSETQNVAWKLGVPGAGWSSPIVWGDTIFLTSAVSAGTESLPKPGLDRDQGQAYALGSGKDPTWTVARRWVLYAVDFNTGRIRWERLLHGGTPTEAKHLKNSYASETPVTDGKTVFVYAGGARRLSAVDFSGKLVWSTEVTQPEIAPEAIEAAIAAQKTPLPASGDLLNMGSAASPALHQNRIYVTNDHRGPPQGRHDVGEWFLAAFDTSSGREVWRVHEMKNDAYGWSSPYVWVNALRTEVVIVGNGKVRSFDTDGNLLWTINRISRNSTPTPFAANGLLYVSSGYPTDAFRPVYAIRPGASGDITPKDGDTGNAHIAWSDGRLASYLPSALAYGGMLYHLHSLGLVQANDALTGRPVYGRTRISPDAGTFTASPWAYNGKIFALSEEGDTYVMQAGPEFRVLRKNPLGEMALATPAIAGDSLIIRTASSLWRIARTAQ